MSKTYKTSNLIWTVLEYILIFLLIFGIVGAIAMLIDDLTAPSGIYVVYADEEYYSDNDGMAIEWEGQSYEATFTIKSTDDWGNYSVEDCDIRVIPYSSAETFEFYIDDLYYDYCSETDLTAAFIKDYADYSGNGIEVNSDGEFTIYLDEEYTSCNIETAMDTVLSRVYNTDSLWLYSTYDISSSFYFVIQVISPDGNSVIQIPFTVKGEYTAYYDISYTYVHSAEHEFEVTRLVGPSTAAKGESIDVNIYGTGMVTVDTVEMYVVKTGNVVTGIYTTENMYHFSMPASDVIIVFSIIDTDILSDSGNFVVYSGGGSGTVDGEDTEPDGEDNEQYGGDEDTEYAITWNLTYISSDEDLPASAYWGETVSVVLSADTGKQLPGSILVSGSEIYSWDSNTGILTFFVTGDTEITIEAYKAIYTITWNLVNTTSSDTLPSKGYYGDNISVIFTPANGYTFKYGSIEYTGNSSYAVGLDFDTGECSFMLADNVEITITSYYICTLTWNLSNVTLSSGTLPTTAIYGDTVSASFTPDTNYTIPDSITVSGSGSYTWNTTTSNGKLSFVCTGDTEITIAGDLADGYYSLTYDLIGVTATSSLPSVVQTTDTVNLTFEVNSGYTFGVQSYDEDTGTVYVTSYGNYPIGWLDFDDLYCDLVSYSNNDGVVTLSLTNFTYDCRISIEALKKHRVYWNISDSVIISNVYDATGDYLSEFLEDSVYYYRVTRVQIGFYCADGYTITSVTSSKTGVLYPEYYSYSYVLNDSGTVGFLYLYFRVDSESLCDTFDDIYITITATETSA
ncbi:MAG: hypothetical protein LUI60_02065 [Clostridia bacterium]|nr:hypothetical protein [Clostridia bacterium]